MSTWFTSDLHFGHVNIIQYSGRPFTDVDQMNTSLIDRWNALVQPGDDVWVLGDVAMGHIADTLPLVGRLAGYKRLLAGNHDRSAVRPSPHTACRMMAMTTGSMP